MPKLVKLFTSLKNYYGTLDRNMWATLISRIISAIGYMMLTPFLAIILIKQHGLNALIVAPIVAVYTFSQTGLMIPATFIINIIGYKKGMIIGRILAGVTAIAYCYVSNVSLLIIISLIIGLGTSMFNLACKGYISLETNEDSQKKLNAFAMYNVAMNLGSSLGPLIGSFFIQTNYFAWLLYIIAALNIVTALVVDRMTVETSTTSKIQKEKLSTTIKGFLNIFINKQSYPLIIVTFLLQIIFTQFFSVMPLYFSNQKLNITTYSLMLIINTVLCIVLQVPVLHISNKIIHGSNYIGLGLSGLFLAIGLCLMSISNNYLLLIVVAIILTIGELYLTPFQDKAVSDIVINSHNTTSYFSVFSLIWSIGKGFGNFVGLTMLSEVKNSIFWVLISFFGWFAVILSIVFAIFKEKFDTKNKIASASV